MVAGHKDKSGKFHPHNNHQSAIHAKDVHSNKVKQKDSRYIHGSREADIKARNAELAKIDRRNEKLEEIMLEEQGKGKNHDGRTSRANKALAEYEKNQDLISKISFHKYGHLK